MFVAFVVVGGGAVAVACPLRAYVHPYIHTYNFSNAMTGESTFMRALSTTFAEAIYVRVYALYKHFFTHIHVKTYIHT